MTKFDLVFMLFMWLAILAIAPIPTLAATLGFLVTYGVFAWIDSSLL